MRSIRRGLCLLAFLLFANSPIPAQEDLGGSEHLPILQDLELFNRIDEDDRIAILLEEGMTAPPQLLLQLSAAGRVVLEVEHGPARFVLTTSEDENGSTVRRIEYSDDRIYLPPIKSGPAGRDSVLAISLDGKPIGSPLRIGTLDANTIDRLWLEMMSTAPAILRMNRELRYGVMDPKKVDWNRLQEDAARLRPVAAVLGKRCSWLDTRAHSNWADCPL